MKFRRILILVFLFTIVATSGCNSKLLEQPSASNVPSSEAPVVSEATAVVSSEPTLPEALVDFRVQIPEDTPTTDDIYLTILDEVTGLYLNSQSYKMNGDESTGVYSAQLPFPVGSVIKYRYERQGDELRVAEHTSNGSPVRYRMAVINGPSSLDDVISRWTDTTYTSPSGRIMGTATDAASGLPISNLLITAGGAQTFTTADGSFLLEGLPPGIHNLIGYALDGAYQVFQQGAEIAADSTTPASIQLIAAPLVNVTFIVTPPTNTPPLVPMRLAGNLYQLGNTFGTLTGGVSTLATRMPVLSQLPDGRYQVLLHLPTGADIQYKYTLGDGYWNAEHTADGAFQLRQLIVPDQDITIQDNIVTWQTNPGATVTFDLSVPETTPPGDFVSIQFNPLFGWTEPVPMWSLGGNRWAYVLYSPLNLPGNLGYRYCRNNQCGTADDAATPGLYGAGRTVNLENLPQEIKENVDAWIGLEQSIDLATIPTAEVNPRAENFAAGIEFIPNYHPSWQPIMPQTLQRVKDIRSNWLVLDPTWSVTRANPPVFEQVAGRDALWFDLVSTIQQAHEQGIEVAVKPVPNFTYLPSPVCITTPCPTATEFWWQEGARDFSWWLVWFDHYRSFILHHADLAAQTGAEALVMGGEWLNPALPGGTTIDGQPSGIPSDAEQRWRNLIGEVRQRFPGTLMWALPYKEGQAIPTFIDAVDQIYLEWPVEPVNTDSPQPSAADLELQFGEQLDGKVKEFQTSIGKPLILALLSVSNPNLESQQNAYQAMLNAINQRDWISGFISSGYFPPASLQDQSNSVHGKPAEALLQNWYPGLTGTQP